ncbi:ABC transporter permease [Pseudosulfitobacter pseudonitzschiae]|uniref:ABC transporter permease n=1 Tax=Pseudosulfitobacter pseudonitzschiae TaxID=1402135 RepID=A0A073J2C0_9RHOB|nr:ABC transporter permease [Pseudosulfitobacter pseudonitzschiae]KEJ96753.1 ABC transporter permease [Pseudosulfitobacter pseudonitzschiae]MBM1814242.1 ABC transporter permease [Pseudosulfitobacter pseudonitzschiae]MBM1831235.1 ABC transporter permease [Pseudosulfitobacter pseudonitzschiae]MBM1836102.1 ABC transporter permease [Pseudosulfitobacter pseudonitzschiae]MBM1840948.1 ABC transporter permease [Pseudosulfitobacter pseudonitzschiae]|tara:strand:+ start:5814 stop:6791 length:978 start_codon:yes stop_codon:yes gene_type:complete
MAIAGTILGRLLKAALTLFAIAVLNFFLIHAAPGDPAAVLAGEAGAADEQMIADLRAQFGLDQPLYVQLYRYVGNILTLDLGYSFRQGAPVLDLILERLPATLILTLTAFWISLLAGVALGVAASARVGKFTDSLITGTALLFYATPLYWAALMAVLVFSVQLGWLPGFGYETVGSGYGGFDRAIDILKHLILPALTLGLFFMAVYMRMTRASMLEVAQQDFVKTARAKGLAPSVIRRRHILRNALLPVVTLAGLQAGQLVGGAVLTETVFAWPGIGRLMFESLAARDYNTILGVFLVSALMVIIFNIITDIVYRLIDPRIGQKA